MAHVATTYNPRLICSVKKDIVSKTALFPRIVIHLVFISPHVENPSRPYLAIIAVLTLLSLPRNPRSPYIAIQILATLAILT